MKFLDLKRQYSRMSTEINAALAGVLDHGRYVMGPEIEQLEADLATFVGAPHCVAVSSGSTALLCALMALDIGPGDEVIVPDFTFIAPAEMVMLLGATPILVDIDPLTYNLDPTVLTAAITPKTRAIIGVSLYGQPADFTAINAIAEPKGIAVIEDAAQSLGASQHGRSSGNLTPIACTSFFPSKPLGGYGDGGAIFCQDADMAARLRATRQHGETERYHHQYLGLTGRMSSFQAAVLQVKLKHFPAELAERAAIAEIYDRALANVVGTPQLAPGNTSSYAQYTIAVNDRDALKAALAEQSIPTAIHYPRPIHTQLVYQSRVRGVVSCPQSVLATERVLSLPFGVGLTKEEANTVIEAVLAFYST